MMMVLIGADRIIFLLYAINKKIKLVLIKNPMVCSISRPRRCSRARLYGNFDMGFGAFLLHACLVPPYACMFKLYTVLRALCGTLY